MYVIPNAKILLKRVRNVSFSMLQYIQTIINFYFIPWWINFHFERAHIHMGQVPLEEAQLVPLEWHVKPIFSPRGRM
jgi:hypothetical protein